MASWSAKRKLGYASMVFGVILIFIIIPSFYFFYKAPTCFDNIMNGDETGMDCGGSCARLCQSAFLPPRIEWGGAKIEKLADGLYNAASYIVNPNINGGAVDVPYKISLYDSEGILITEKNGVVNLYPRRNSLAFQTAINTGKRIPTKATFEFTKSPVWFKSTDKLDGIIVSDKKYTEDQNGSSLEVTLENKNLTSYNNINVSVVLSDINGNVIGFSQTRVDVVGVKGVNDNHIEVAPFTWPISRDGKVTSIEVMPLIRPVLSQ